VAGESIRASVTRLREELVAVVALWKELCGADPLLEGTNRDERIAEAFVGALSEPQPIAEGPDPSLRTAAIAYATTVASLDVAAHEILYLAAASQQILAGMVEAIDRVDVEVRVRHAAAWILLVIGGRFAAVGRDAARRDSLTGLLTRPAFEDDLGAELARGTNVTVTFLDMDGLKAINDHDGHEAGDAAIRAVADAISAGRGPAGRAYRWGGDEFVMMITDTSRDEVVVILEAIQTAAPYPVSWGLASTSDCPREVGELVRRADAAMYAMKSARKTPR
jgi:diguanylate cyclase (GGDEF)-like protein